MKKLLFIGFILFLNIVLVYGASNPYKETSSYGTNCTWYAWKMAYEKGGVALPGWGNAKNWYSDAKKSGYKVGSTPNANSIVVWGNWTSYGHVGYVEKVTSDAIYVWDSTGPCIDTEDEEFKTCLANSINEETGRICYNNAKRIACEYSLTEPRYEVTGYIYLNEKPTKTENSTNSSTSKNNSSSSNTNTKKEEAKSSNANLKELEIGDEEFQFSSTTLTYNIEVDNEIETIKVKAVAEDSKSTIDGIGEYDLNVGLNEIKIKVTAEDKTAKTYIVNITRKEKEEPVEIETPEEKEDSKEEPSLTSKKSKKISKKYYIAIIALALLIVILPLSIVLVKRKKY